MLWTFIVVGKTLAIVSDPHGRFVESYELLGGNSCFLRSCLGIAKNRIKGVLREDVFDVGDEQFLVLFLVMKAQPNDRFCFREKCVIRFIDDLDDTGVDLISIAIRFGDSWPRDQAAKV